MLLVAVKMEKDKLIEHEKRERVCDIIMNYREPKRILLHGGFCHLSFEYSENKQNDRNKTECK